MKKTSFKDTLLLLLLIPVFLLMACFALAELFSPITHLASIIEDNWDITPFQAYSVAFSWLFWLVASIITGVFLDNEGYETLTVVFGISTALLFGILFNVLLAENNPLLCGITSFLYLVIIWYFRIKRDR